VQNLYFWVRQFLKRWLTQRLEPFETLETIVELGNLKYLKLVCFTRSEEGNIKFQWEIIFTIAFSVIFMAQSYFFTAEMSAAITNPFVISGLVHIHCLHCTTNDRTFHCTGCVLPLECHRVHDVQQDQRSYPLVVLRWPQGYFCNL